MKTRQFAREDIPSILAIQGKCPQSSQWLPADYIWLAESPSGMMLVAELDTMTPPKVVGFVAFRRAIDEADLMNLAVDPEHHHQGAGKALLEEARQRLIKAGAKRVFLEVRLSNKSALALYYSVGFGIRALRKNYYQDPPEDAYVLCLELSPPVEVGKASQAHNP